MSVPAKLAATVILLRDPPDGGIGYELFLVRRHRQSRFMGGAHVFPGGKLDDADSDAELFALTAGRTEAECRALLGEQRAPGLFVAGIRETFEEAGAVLAAPRGTDAPLDLGADEVMERYARHRIALDRDAQTLARLAREEQLTLRLDWLRFWAHWITPELEQRRYDTYFFVTRVPPGQRLVHDQRETVESLWISPPEALRRHRQETLLLMPPTLRNMEILAALDSVAAVLAAADRPETPVICPTVHQEGDDIVLLLPGDPAYRIPATVADHPFAGRGLGGPTRFLLRDGRWHTSSSFDDD